MSILIYPVAEYDLAAFLETINAGEVDALTWYAMVSSCNRFFGCLSSALAHIHARAVKHMDIKPPNILVRDVGRSDAQSESRFKVYIADFGIARAYDSIDSVETDGPTLCTRKFASPEVIRQELRGHPADVFSLGCVFLEMMTTLCDYHHISLDTLDTSRINAGVDDILASWHGKYMILSRTMHSTVQQLQKLLQANTSNDSSYQANLGAIKCTFKRPQNQWNKGKIRVRALWIWITLHF